MGSNSDPVMPPVPVCTHRSRFAGKTHSRCHKACNNLYVTFPERKKSLFD